MRLTALLEKKSSSNVSEATLQLLQQLQIPVTSTTAIDKVESHPDFPSLYSISDSLTAWKVENAAFEVEPEKLDDLPTPFIAHTRTGGGSFVVVQAVNGTVDYVDEKGRDVKGDRETFLKAWTNTVLLAEKTAASGEMNFAKARKAERLAGLRIPLIAGSGLLLVLLYTVLYSSTGRGIAGSLLLFTKLCGCAVSGLLLWFEVDKSNKALQQFCTGTGNTNCTAVLSSKAGKLFPWLSWSEVGFFYFTGGFLFLLSSTNNHLPSFSVLAWLNLFALPYTVFSVYYQWRVAKQWCPLCLTVQVLLITEFIICYFGYWSSATVTVSLPNSITSADQLIAVLTSFLLPVLFWVVAKPALLAAQKGRAYKKDLARLKYNKEIFTALLHKQKKIEHSTEGLGITLGNPAAKHTLVKVCNPYCGPCAKAHAAIDELLEGNDVKVQIIFTATTAEEDNKAAPVKHLMAVYEGGDEQVTQQALDDWYNADKKDYEEFSANHPVKKEELENQGAKLKAMDSWCTAAGISFTPTIYIDGYQLPELYTVEDLKHLL